MRERPSGKGNRERQPSEFEERVVEISRVSRVVKGGRRIRFRILVVIGDQKGKIGYGIAKATEIAVGVKKAVAAAKKRMIIVPTVNDTIPYPINFEYGSSKIYLGPASQGTSIVAGGVVRTVAELAGIKNLLSKVIGTSNKVNNVKAMFAALSSFEPAKVEIVKKRNLQTAKEIKPEVLATEGSETETVESVIKEIKPKEEVKASAKAAKKPAKTRAKKIIKK